MKITKEMIFDGRSKQGGWARKQVEALGIQWPLTSGWIDRAIGEEVSQEQVEKFRQSARKRPTKQEQVADMWPEDIEHLRVIQREEPLEMERAGPTITGENYKPDGCACGLPPWELCRPTCEHQI